MIRNYLKIAWRNITNSMAYSSINILGLAAGLSSFIVILLYLNYELSYDKWSPELKKVYKVSVQHNTDILSQSPAPLASFLVQKYADAEAGTSLQSSGDFEALVDANNKKIYLKDVVMADSSFFKVFPFKLIVGDAASALNAPKSVVITQDVSNKLFGNDNPIGKSIKLYGAIDGVITGIMEEPKTPTHLPVKMVMRDPYGKSNSFWQNYSYQTYIKLKYPEQEARVEDAINQAFYNGHLKHDSKSYTDYKASDKHTSLFIDAVPDIHNFPKHANSNFTTVSILLSLAVLLLLAGAINFSNLAIAKSMRRAKEVGVRKVLGSARRQLVIQFMMETALQCFVSLIISILIIYVALPYINTSFNINLSFWQQDNMLSIIGQIFLCLLAVTLLSGLYPSLFLSRFNTSKVLKGDYSSGKNGMLFRNSLIVVQFMVSVFFIAAILIIDGQMRYMQTKDKGFSGEQVMRIQANQASRDKGFETVRNTLLGIPGVSYVAKTTQVPGDNLRTDTTTYDFNYSGSQYRMASVKISADYFKALKIGLINGRYFTDSYPDQNTRTAIINESAAKKLGKGNPIGKTITFPNCDSIPVQIVGVVKDFNVQGFESSVQPMVYTIGNKACMFQSGGALLVKLSSNNMQQSVVEISEAWKKIEPGFPIRYSFLDDNFQQLLVSYFRLQKIITFFAIVAILISAMGLFALTAFFIKQRTKEIGIRKILGANIPQLTSLLGKEFIYLVLLAVLVITPFAWWCMQKWLQTFAYRISISWWFFVIAGFSAILMAAITISIQSVKAALANPADSLRNE
jgi:putative ABC transport system permease protein